MEILSDFRAYSTLSWFESKPAEILSGAEIKNSGIRKKNLGYILSKEYNIIN